MIRFALVAMVALACKPTIPEDTLVCDERRSCPAGFMCVAGRCSRDGEAYDGGRDAAIDPPPLDAGCATCECEMMGGVCYSETESACPTCNRCVGCDACRDIVTCTLIDQREIESGCYCAEELDRGGMCRRDGECANSLPCIHGTCGNPETGGEWEACNAGIPACDDDDPMVDCTDGVCLRSCGSDDECTGPGFGRCVLGVCSAVGPGDEWQPCVTSDDCAGLECRPIEGPEPQSICVRPCADDGDCTSPSFSKCEDGDASGERECWPGDCDFVANTGCGDGEYCQPGFVDLLPMTYFVRGRCAPASFRAREGADCRFETCGAGMTCVQETMGGPGRCYFLCYPDGGVACPNDVACSIIGERGAEHRPFGVCPLREGAGP